MRGNIWLLPSSDVGKRNVDKDGHTSKIYRLDKVIIWVSVINFELRGRIFVDPA